VEGVGDGLPGGGEVGEAGVLLAVGGDGLPGGGDDLVGVGGDLGEGEGGPDDGEEQDS